MPCGRAPARARPSCRRSCSTTTRSGPIRWRTDAVRWAAESGVRCADEDLLEPVAVSDAPGLVRGAAGAHRGAAGRDSAPTRASSSSITGRCAAITRCCRASRGFRSGAARARPRHGTRRYAIDMVVYGHLHMRSTRKLDGVRFEEVSLGYPKQWDPRRPSPATSAKSSNATAGDQIVTRRSAAARSVSSFLAKQNRSTGPPPSL